jgi:oxalate decarboxylase
VTIFGHDAEYSTFLIHAGQMFFIPSGYFHHIENIGNGTEAELIIAFSHELPTDINLSSAISAMR